MYTYLFYTKIEPSNMFHNLRFSTVSFNVLEAFLHGNKNSSVKGCVRVVADSTV